AGHRHRSPVPRLAGEEGSRPAPTDAPLEADHAPSHSRAAPGTGGRHRRVGRRPRGHAGCSRCRAVRRAGERVPAAAQRDHPAAGRFRRGAGGVEPGLGAVLDDAGFGGRRGRPLLARRALRPGADVRAVGEAAAGEDVRSAAHRGVVRPALHHGGLPRPDGADLPQPDLGARRRRADADAPVPDAHRARQPGLEQCPGAGGVLAGGAVGRGRGVRRCPQQGGPRGEPPRRRRVRGRAGEGGARCGPAPPRLMRGLPFSAGARSGRRRATARDDLARGRRAALGSSAVHEDGADVVPHDSADAPGGSANILDASADGLGTSADPVAGRSTVPTPASLPRRGPGAPLASWPRRSAGVLLGCATALLGSLYFLVTGAALGAFLLWPRTRAHALRALMAGARRLAGLERLRRTVFFGDRFPEGFRADGHRILRCLAVRCFAGLLCTVVLGLLGLGAVLAGVLVAGVVRGSLGWGELLTQAVLGGVLLFLDVQGLRSLAALDARAVRECFGPSEREVLQQRIEALAASRAAVVRAVDAERRRIERDLHDGVQQRLVALAMLLGRARRSRDPERADALLLQAHEESRDVLTELREVAWRVYPSALDSLGLREALGGVAERCALPLRLR